MKTVEFFLIELEKRLFLVFRIPNPHRYAKQIEFSPLLNGIGIVFNDGTAGLIISETSKFEPQVNRSKIQDERDEKKILDTFVFC